MPPPVIAPPTPLEQEARRAIRLFYIFQVSYGLLLWMPIFYDYQKTAGLLDSQIFNIQSWYYISFCLLELPTGFIADRFGYRLSMIVGAVLNIVTNLIPVYFLSYNGFLAHWLLLSLSRSLVSGAASAYLYNHLENLDQVELYKGAEGKARAYSLYSRVIGFAAAGLLCRMHPAMPYILSAAAAVLAALAALRIGPIAVKKNEPPAPSPRFSQIAVLIVRSPMLVLLMLQGIGIFVLTRIVQVNLFQPLLQAGGWGPMHYGPVLALNTVFEAWTAARPQMLRPWMRDFTAVGFLTAGLSVCCLGLGVASAYGSIVWLTLFAGFAGLAYPIQRQVMNEAIPDSNYRASILSAESVLDRAFCALVAHQVGAFVQSNRMGTYLLMAGGICMVVNLTISGVGLALSKPTKPEHQ